MYVIKELRLNKYRPVSIPKNQDLFMRVGPRPMPNMVDGQVAHFSNGEMEHLDYVESDLIRESEEVQK